MTKLQVSPNGSQKNAISTLLRAAFKKTEISKQLNVSRMTVHREKPRLKASESLRNRHRSGIPQVISQEATKKAFEITHAIKWQEWHKRSKCQSPLCPGWSKRWEENVWDVPENPCWVLQWCRSFYGGAPICRMTWRITWIEATFFSNKKAFTIDLVFNKQNDQVAPFGNDVFGDLRMSTTKHLASIVMFDVVASNREMPLVWFEQGYSLTPSVYKDVLQTKVLLWVKKITKKSDYDIQQDGAWLDANMSFWLNEFWLSRSPD